MSSIVLNCNTFTGDDTAWTEVGTSPYLDAQDQPTNYIYNASKKAAQGYFGFEDSGSLGVIGTVNLEMYGWNASALDVHDLDMNGNAYNISFPQGAWGWSTVDITSDYSDWSIISNASLQIISENNNNAVSIDVARIVVYYAAGSETADVYLTSLYGNLANVSQTYDFINDIRNTVNKSIDGFHTLYVSASKLYSFIWDDISQVSSTLTGIYSYILPKVDKVLTVIHNNLSNVSKTIEGLYKRFERLGQNDFSNHLNVFQIRDYVDAINSIGYDISSGLEQVSKLLISIWKSYANVDVTLTSLSNIKSYVTKASSMLYDNLVAVSSQLSSLWKNIASVSKTVVIDYGFAGLVNKLITLTHGLLQNINATSSFNFNVKTKVNQTISSVHKLLSNVSKSSVIGYKLLQNISKLLGIEYNVGIGWLSGWSYRKQHVFNSLTGAGSNYQAKFIGHQDSGSDSGDNVYFNFKVNPDYSDIRVTKVDGLTLVDSWLGENKRTVSIATSNARDQGIHNIIRPSTYYFNGYTYFGYIGHSTDFDVYIKRFDHSTKQWSSPVYVHDGYDNHGAPCIWVDADGYIHVIGSGHDAAYLHHSVSTNTEDISAWTALDDIDDGSYATSYPTIYQDPTDKDTVWLLAREGYASDSSWFIWKSTDGGTTWSLKQTIVDYETAQYVMPGQMYDGKIYLIFLEYDYGGNGNVDYFAFYFDTSDNKCYAPDGTDLGTTVTTSEALSYCQVIDSQPYNIGGAVTRVGTTGDWYIIANVEDSSESFWRLNLYKWNGSSWDMTTLQEIPISKYIEFRVLDENDLQIWLGCNDASTTYQTVQEWRYKDGKFTHVRNLFLGSDSPYTVMYIKWQIHSNGIDLLFADQYLGQPSTDIKVYAYSYSGIFGSDQDIWVKVPEDISSNPYTIYVYYGNGGASTVSSIIDTMLAGNDGVEGNFSEETVGTGSLETTLDVYRSSGNSTGDAYVAGYDITNWNWYASVERMDVASSSLSSDNDEVIFGLFDSDTIDITGTSVNVDAKRRFVVTRTAPGSDLYSNSIMVAYYDDGGTMRTWDGSAWTTNTVRTSATYDVHVDMWSDGSNLFADIYKETTNTSYFSSSASISISSVDTFTNGTVLVYGEPYTDKGYITTQVDDFYIRKYVGSEVTNGTWGEEESEGIFVYKLLVFMFDSIGGVIKQLASIFGINNVVNTSVEAIYKLRENVFNTTALKYNIQSLVNKTSSFLHNILANVSSSTTMKYNLNTIVNKVQSLLYDIIAKVSNNTELTYNIRSLKERTLSLLYSLKSKISNSVTMGYEIREYISNSISSIYGLLSNVSNTLEARYGLIAKVNKLFSSFYDVIVGGIVNTTISLSYSLVSKVNQLLNSLYDNRVTREKLSSFGYNLKSNVSKAISILYKLKANISDILNGNWTISENVSNSIVAGGYNILENVTKILDSIYDNMTNVSKTLESIYNIIAKLNVNVEISYEINKLVNATLSSLHKLYANISNSIVSEYGLRTKISKVLSAFYDIIVSGIVSKTLSLTHSLIAKVNDSLDVKYSIMSLRDKLYSFSWKLKENISKSIISPYGLRANVTKQLSSFYNIIVSGMVNLQFVMSYSLRQNINKLLSSNYSILELMGKTMELGYNILSNIDKLFIGNYNNIVNVIKSFSSNYLTKTNINNSLSSMYTIVSKVSKILVSSWYILSGYITSIITEVIKPTSTYIVVSGKNTYEIIKKKARYILKTLLKRGES